MASEVGVLDIPPEDIVLKERLHPGRIFLVDTARGRIVSDEEVKRELAAAQPYKRVADAPDRHRRSRSGAVPAAAEPRDGHAAPAAVRLHARGSAAAARADGDQRRGSRSARWAPTRRSRRCRTGRGCSTTTSSRCSRRSPTRRSTRSARSWSRRWSRRSGPKGNLLDPRPESCRQIRSSTRSSTTISSRSCGTSTIPGSAPIRLPMLFDATQDGPGLERALEDLKRARQRRRRSRLHDPDPVGPRRRSRPRADPEPARHGRRAPSPGPPGHAHALRAGRRIRRRARSAPLRAAARLRRRRGQPVPRVRDARRHDPPADSRRHRRTSRR